MILSKNVMEGKEKDRKHKNEMEEKRNLGGKEELLHYSDEVKKKKKKKRKKTDEQEEESKDMENTPTKRRRKESEGENDWSARHKSNTELIEVRALDKRHRTELENELVTHKKKKKKKKMEHEQRPEESEVSELLTPNKKKKKKRRRETAEEEETSQSSLEDSFTSPSVVEKRNEERKGGEKGGTNAHYPKEHTFLKPFPAPERRGGGRVGKDEEKGRESWCYRSQRMKEKRIPEEEGRREETESHKNQGLSGGRTKMKDVGEKEIEEGKRRLTGVVSRLAYNGMLGWETDTSVDDLDYSDDLYHQSPAALKERLMLERRRPTMQGAIIYSEGEEIEGFVPDPRYSSCDESNDWTTVEVPLTKRSSPGFVFEQREIPTLEEAMYKFPLGVGTPLDEVEEVQDAENYWIMKDKVLHPSSFAEEAKEYIDAKMRYSEDYFERLQEGHLSPSEMKETRPQDFDEPYYPTPRQLKFLDTLNIKVNWPLSDLHKYHLTTYTIPYKNKHEWHSLRIFADTSRLTLRDDKIIARNWFAFQKEYSFYDLRPLVSVRTARIMKEAGKMMVQPYEYLSQRNKVHFLLYLAKDLPTRTLVQIERKIQKLLPFLRGRCLMRKAQRVTGLMLAKLQYVIEVFGVDLVAAELLIGQSLRSFFNRSFITHIMLRNVKLRIGPWREDEDRRLLQGLQEVMHARTFEDAYRLRRVPWMSIFPYVRTRNTTYMRRRLIVLASRSGEKNDLNAARREMARFIRLLYNKQIEDFLYLDWEGLAREVGAANPVRLVWSFRKLYFNHIPYNHRITVPEGLRYMYHRFIPFYEKTSHYRIPQPGDPDYQEPQHSTPDPDDPSRDPSTHSSDPLSPSNDLVHAISPSRDSSGPSDLRNEPSDPRNTGDHSRLKMTSVSHRYDPKINNKVTRKQNDHKYSRKVKDRIPDDLTNPKKMTCDDPSKETHIEHDLSTCVSSQECDPDDNLMSCDLSDSDSDMTSGSDGYDFEQVTLGQALGRNVGQVRKSR